MYPSPTQLLALQKTQIDALQAFGSTVFDATEKLAQLNLATTRTILQDGVEVAHNLLAAKDPQELTTIGGNYAQPGAEKIASYSRSAYTIASNASAEFTRIVEAQIAEGNRKMAEAFEAVTRSAPPGSEHAISLLKNSISAASTAFDAVTKAARAASETAESNIAAAVAVASDAIKAKTKKTA
jgi:phasin family protein